MNVVNCTLVTPLMDASNFLCLYKRNYRSSLQMLLLLLLATYTSLYWGIYEKCVVLQKCIQLFSSLIDFFPIFSLFMIIFDRQMHLFQRDFVVFIIFNINKQNVLYTFNPWLFNLFLFLLPCWFFVLNFCVFLF